jgi:hypothetical protein
MVVVVMMMIQRFFNRGVNEKCAINITLNRKTVCYRQSNLIFSILIYQLSLYFPPVSHEFPQGFRYQLF